MKIDWFCCATHHTPDDIIIFFTNIEQNLIKLIEFHMSKKMEKKLMIKFKYVFWIKYPWWTSKSKVNPLCFKFQSWCLKPRLIYAILLFSWPNSSLITRNWNFGVLRQKTFDIKHLPARPAFDWLKETWDLFISIFNHH